MKYVDASVVVSLFTREATSEARIAWLERQQRGSLASSEWLWTEVSSALARKARMERLSGDEYAQTLRHIQDLAPELEVYSLDTVDFRTAASFCGRYEHGLRAGDALHLAVSVRTNCTLTTSDKRLATGAKALGHQVELIG